MVFIGFMGAGKSTALAVAREHGLETIEIDELMEPKFGNARSAEAFAEHGEEEFRRREAEVVGELLEEADGGAIALGGGSILSERVRDALARHVVVWLQISAEEAWRRIEGTGRPLARSQEDVGRVARAAPAALRAPRRRGGHACRTRGCTSAPGTAIAALREMPAGTKLLWAASASGEYPVFAGEDILGALVAPARAAGSASPTGAVGPAYGDRMGPLAARIEVEPGESAKTLAEAERVLRELTAAGMLRIGSRGRLGGGVVGDLAGFCAHTFQRGVPVVQVPTTVVAQVDSAYGGKTGVDLPEGKNYVGAHHLPAAVFADWETIGTLPRRSWLPGTSRC